MENLIFNRPEWGWNIRAVEISGEPWFVAKDVAAALGYERTADAVRAHVEEEDKGVCDLPTPGGVQTMTTINESGLYSLILSSKLGSAKQFKKWITGEVIPSIRKHGAYATPATIENIIKNPDFGIQLLNTLKEEQEKNKRLTAENESLQPARIFSEAVAVSDDCILVGELAKILKQNGVEIGQTRLFNWLRNTGYLIKQNGQNYNLPTQYAMERQLFKVKERTINNPDGSVRLTRTVLVTGKGQQYFINKFLGA